MKAPESVVSRVRKLMDKNGQVKSAANRGVAAGSSTVPLDEFVAILYEEGGSSYKVGKRLGISHRNVAGRRAFIEEQLGIELPRGRPETWRAQAHRSHLDVELKNGTVLVGSDLHCWPEIYGTAMAAFIDFSRRLKPEWTIMNGDGLDGARISRHSRIGWDQRPTTAEEVEALSDYSDLVLKSNPNGKRKRTRGNHDGRFDTYLSSNAPDMEGVKGTSLADHLPGWDECMSITFNGNCIVQHRYRTGVHAAYNNVRDFGCHVVTGHRHKSEVRPWTNQMGTWYGVDAGMLAPVGHPAFDYTEQKKPTDWRSGFVVLTFVDGKLMPPDLAQVIDEERGLLYFRGETLTYDL